MEPDFASSDPFAQLGIPSDADKKAIRRAYKALVRQYRPETHPDEFQKIRTAYESALAALTWRDHMASFDEPTEDAAEEPGRQHEERRGSRGEGDADDEEQTFEPVFDRPWPEEDEEYGPQLEIPPGSKIAQFLGYAAWTDLAYRKYGLELEALLAKPDEGAAYQRFEELEQVLEDELGEDDGRLSWLRLGTFLARSLAPEGWPKTIDQILKKVDNDRDLDEECFDTLEFTIVILRARAEIEKASKLKYPAWFTSFVFSHLDADPSEINTGLADIRQRLLLMRKKRDIDWLDQLADDLPNFGTLFHILMYRHSDGLLEIIDEGELQSTSGASWNLEEMGSDLQTLEGQLDKGRAFHTALNSIVGITFGVCALGFLALWLIGLFSREHFSSSITLSLLAVAWLLRGAVDRSYAYRFLVRPKLRRLLRRHEAPVALLTGLIRMRDGALPALDYYLPAIETDPKLPPRYRKRDARRADLPYPYLGNLAPR
jgi:curved DNA-binding protein CbpA